MSKPLKRLIRKTFNLIGLDIVRLSKSPVSPKDAFLSYHYQRHNQRRLEHLASLGLNIAGSAVLEVGAGIGDHTSFFIDRGCQIVTSDGRQENTAILRTRYPDVNVLHIDLDSPPKAVIELFDIVYCYGVLYHLKNPSVAIEFMSRCCRKMLLLETCVSFGDGDLFNSLTENAVNPTQSVSGRGSRPTRRWVYNQLKRHFEFVYLPVTQPNHEEFPIDWTRPPSKQTLTRA
ncbi:MAG: methyltransferase domain-containing protein, partial [archaeon]|nr:methyltransferase domain-containing protein [archaeon]